MKRNPLEINIAGGLTSLAGRLIAVLFLLLLGTAAGRATSQQVVFNLNGFVIQDGTPQSGSSTSLLPPAFAYSYEITGTVHGTGNLSSLIPPGTSLASALNTLDGNATPPFSDYLQGTVVNPGGTLPFTILADKTAAGSLAGGIITASATFNLGVDATGKASFSITGVTFLVFGSADTTDTIVFDSGQVTTTAVLTPVVSSGTATSVTGTSATLGASVNPNGDNTTVTFEYGSTAVYTDSTSQVLPVGITATPVSATILGLDPGSTYHYQIVAANSTGTTSGGDETFVTTPAAGAPHLHDRLGERYRNDNGDIEWLGKPQRHRYLGNIRVRHHDQLHVGDDDGRGHRERIIGAAGERAHQRAYAGDAVSLSGDRV